MTGAALAAVADRPDLPTDVGIDFTHSFHVQQRRSNQWLQMCHL